MDYSPRKEVVNASPLLTCWLELEGFPFVFLQGLQEMSLPKTTRVRAISSFHCIYQRGRDFFLYARVFQT